MGSLPNTLTSIPVKELLQDSTNHLAQSIGRSVSSAIAQVERLEGVERAMKTMESLPNTLTSVSVKGLQNSTNHLAQSIGRSVSSAIAQVERLEGVERAMKTMESLPNALANIPAKGLLQNSTNHLVQSVGQLMSLSFAHIERLEGVERAMTTMESLPNALASIPVKELLQDSTNHLAQSIGRSVSSAFAQVERLEGVERAMKTMESLPNTLTSVSVNCLQNSTNNLAQSIGRSVSYGFQNGTNHLGQLIGRSVASTFAQIERLGGIERSTQTVSPGEQLKMRELASADGADNNDDDKANP
jgi:methyl coenzyme M reductase subunit D